MHAVENRYDGCAVYRIAVPETIYIQHISYLLNCFPFADQLIGLHSGSFLGGQLRTALNRYCAFTVASIN